MLAAAPVLFALQQTTEGALWLVLPSAPDGATAKVLTIAFLLFAQVLWPAYAPAAVGLVEPQPVRRRLMAGCLVAGLAIAGYFACRLATGSAQATMEERCIVYDTGGGDPMVVRLGYLLAVAGPLFLSFDPVIVGLGAVVGSGCVIAYQFYREAFLSVWCFFAAAGSVLIWLRLEAARKLAPRRVGE